MAETGAHASSGGSGAPPIHKRPLLRIAQITSACSFCKTRKIKCDAMPPACGGCTRFGRSASCSLATDDRSRLSRDYPAHLRDRIEKLQGDLRSLQGKPGRAERLGHPEVRPTLSHPVQETPTSVDTLIADIGAVPVLASSYSSTGGGPSLSSILLGAANKQRATPLGNQKDANGRSPSIPRKDVALRLVQHYIDNVYPRLPFFSIQGFWAQFNSVYSQDAASSHAVGQSRSQDIDQGYSTFTVLLVLAIASSSLSRSADSVVSSRAQSLCQTALEFRESAVRPNTIVGVQSLLFLVQYATLNPSILDAWYLIGVGMRSCIDLGLHQDPHPLDSVSPSLLETRRRLWWSIYSFDRSVSLGCGRPLGISDCMITAQLPTFRIESTASEDQIQGYLQRYRALQVQSHIYDQLDSTLEDHERFPEVFSALSEKLESWSRANLPSYDQTLIESEWLMGRILLYRPCCLKRERSSHDLLELWKASRRFITLYRQLVDSNGILYVQIAAEKLYWVGLAALYSFWHLRIADQIQQFELWTVIQDVLFSIRTLSERWDDGSLLARHFEAASTQVVNAGNTMSSPEHTDECLPDEVRWLADYISLTSIRSMDEQQRQRGNHREGDLRQLVSSMLMDAQDLTTA